jgi:hypothetical protein
LPEKHKHSGDAATVADAVAMLHATYCGVVAGVAAVTNRTTVASGHRLRLPASLNG